MSWSPGQQAMLEAMGLQVMVRAPANAPMAAETAVHEAPRLSGPSAAVALSAPAPIGGPEAAAEHAALARALLRASGGRDITGLAGDLARLRREPALKRALWPRLRSLRRSH